MKIRLTILAICFIATSSFGQIMSYMTSLQISDSDIIVAELSLIHRSRSNYKDIRDLGKRTIMIPNEINGQKLKIEHSRFNTYEGTPFEMNGTTYIPVQLSYDNETADPKDDIHILSIPFPVETKLVLQELTNYQELAVNTSKFQNAPKGDPNYEIETIVEIEKNKN